jgi:hydrogenase maturation protease
MNQKTLILGLGNDILADDGIGPRLVRDLSSSINGDNIHFEIFASGGLEIVDFMRNFNKVIIIDAIRTEKGKPGDVYYFIPSDVTKTNYLPSFHDINFLTALQLGRTLSPNLTHDIHIIAIEILEDMVFSEEFTPPIKKRYAEILKEVTRWIAISLKN